MLPKDFFIFFSCRCLAWLESISVQGQKVKLFPRDVCNFQAEKSSQCHGREDGENAEKLLDLLQSHNTPDQRGGRQASADSSLSESLKVSPTSTCSLLTLQQHCCSLSCLSCLTTCSSSSSPLGSRPVLARCLGASRCLWVLAR